MFRYHLFIQLGLANGGFSSPTKILRSFPPLVAETVIEVTLSIVKKIPDDVFAEIVSHAK